MRKDILPKVALILRWIAAIIFLYAGWEKLRDPQPFADNIAAYQLLPAQLIDLFALALPPLELIVGCLLLLGWQRRTALFSALLLCLMFAAALTSAVARGLTIDCGCFGAENSSGSSLWTALFRDLCLGVALFFLYWQELQATRSAAETGLRAPAISPNEQT